MNMTTAQIRSAVRHGAVRLASSTHFRHGRRHRVADTALDGMSETLWVFCRCGEVILVTAEAVENARRPFVRRRPRRAL